MHHPTYCDTVHYNLPWPIRFSKELQSTECCGHNWCTFAVAFIPGKDTVLNAVAHQRSVDAHVAVAEERAAPTGS